jgi:muconolactone delta-isomerase
MKFLVVAIPDRTVDRGPIQQAETEAVDRLRSAGVIEQIFVRADGTSSLSILEADSEDAVRNHVESLPFYQHKAMTVEIAEIRVV